MILNKPWFTSSVSFTSRRYVLKCKIIIPYCSIFWFRVLKEKCQKGSLFVSVFFSSSACPSQSMWLLFFSGGCKEVKRENRMLCRTPYTRKRSRRKRDTSKCVCVLVFTYFVFYSSAVLFLIFSPKSAFKIIANINCIFATGNA